MRRRWGILTAMLTLLAGLTLATGSASASTGTMNISPGGPIHLVTSSATGNASAHGIGHATATSTNWSGYAATTGTYTSVSASWTEPTGTCSGSAKYSSFWVGLDGYNSNSVEQTGSEVDCSGSTPVYYAWYEMFPHPSFSYSNTVRPGDHFNASVTYTGSNHFSLFIQDTTRGLEPHPHRDPGGRAPVLGRGDRRGAVLHRERRHPAAGQLRHGQHHRFPGQRRGTRQRRRRHRDHHGQQLGPGEGQRLVPQRRRELQRQMAPCQLTAC